MSRYITPQMQYALKDHQLEQKGEKHFFMQKPDDWNLSLHVAEVGKRIVLTGDLTIGGHGIVSTVGYGLDWFGSPKGEGYLCEKFFYRQVWQWERAKEELEYWLEAGYVDVPEHRRTICQILVADQRQDWTIRDIDAFGWSTDAPNEYELYEALSKLDNGYVDDGVPGYDWPRHDAGWLCAAQQRFAQLYSQRAVAA